MKKFMNLIFIFMCFALYGQDDPVGFWNTIDENTQKPQSIIAIYKHDGKYYGRLVATYDEKGNIADTIYNPKTKAPGVVGNPYYSGLDIMWDLEKDGDKYTNGEILDPEKGRKYDAEMWVKDGKLVVRGEVFFLGRNQTWLPVSPTTFNANFKKPDISKFTPKKPKIKDDEGDDSAD